MRRWLLTLLHLRPGEFHRVAWVGVIGLCWTAATALGDSIAQSVFVTRVGADALPRMFLFKALLDVIAAALYLPLTRNRSPGRVWRAALALYAATVLITRVAAAGGGEVSAYALYVAHECAWTILTIHWGVFILDAFDASQARRLFPLLFTAARLGGVLAGAVLGRLAPVLGALNLLGAAAAFAVAAGVISLLGRAFGAGAGHSYTTVRVVGPAADETEADDEAGGPDGPDSERPRVPAGLAAAALPQVEAVDDGADPRSRRGLIADWRRAASSPLVRAIAVSTAVMVLVRYGLRMVSADEISAAFAHDEDRMAGFLGAFGFWANLAGAFLGVLIVPRILHRLGVGFANLAYAVSTCGAFVALLVAPGLWTAAAARFVNNEFKSALKTPLSTLFYGAEPPHRRALSRAFIFGAIIPVATVATSAILTAGAGAADGLLGVVVIGLAISAVFAIACAVQNRAWRRRLGELLSWKLARTAAPDPARVTAARQAIAALAPLVPPAPRDDDPAVSGPRTPRSPLARRLDEIAAGLASDDPRLRAVAEELLAETAPRRASHATARALAPRAPRVG
jgi:MFS family permease